MNQSERAKARWAKEREDGTVTKRIDAIKAGMKASIEKRSLSTKAVWGSMTEEQRILRIASIKVGIAAGKAPPKCKEGCTCKRHDNKSGYGNRGKKHPVRIPPSVKSCGKAHLWCKVCNPSAAEKRTERFRAGYKAKGKA